ncbi:S41 family peptidase [Elizabethkingia anophelis]|uniref:Peptidase n=2 Tax=Elizabethkingia anophelis TaxID=1117645 RepID=A0A494J7Z5_9FLAO|nr:S41 family peptidase [Elizabethkingia anophelis]AQX51014.1 peptidase [Elizabethkingia anophelis]AVF49759.1 peptidase [Elizabethkingia anophelis]AVF50380.1 peptidase [Elizabethkingia anophelis]ELB0067747.1 peptidase [Elizabethkingia anophelis]ELB1892442.1 peptidase [Elizabethkingia anophelis]
MIKRILLFGFLFSLNTIWSQTKYQKDFNEFWNDIDQKYAYLNEQQINWQKVKEIYSPKVAEINNTYAFVQFLEKVLNELHNGHSSLNTNLDISNKLVPSGQDLYVEKEQNKYIIADVRKESGAEKSGLKAGMEVSLFNRKNIDDQLKQFLPTYTDQYTPAMYQYALDMLFAGTHNVKREIAIVEKDKSVNFYPDNFSAQSGNKQLLESKILNKKTAYLKVNNSLGNNNLISIFDKALDSLLNYKNLVIDLTETPSGGNTTVARAIMGRFTDKILPYQVHEFDEVKYQTKRHWVEYVVPRGKTYKGKLYILVGHWTGSMGEGMAIGFDGMKRAKIMGTKMAGLIGAISGFQMTETKIGYQFPTERLYHVNGTPREDFVPGICTKNTEETLRKAFEIK